MAKNTDKTKKKPQKRNKNSASMEDLQRTQELQRLREVQHAQELQHAQERQQAQELQRTQKVSRKSQASGKVSGKVSGQPTGKASAPVRATANRPVAATPGARAFAEEQTVDTAATVSFDGSAGSAGVKRSSQPNKQSKPHRPSKSNKATGQTVHRRKPTHRPGMSAVIPDVEKPSPEEDFSTKATVSFYDDPSQEAVDEAPFDPYAAADAAFEAGYAGDEDFESKKTQAFDDEDPAATKAQSGASPAGSNSGNAVAKSASGVTTAMPGVGAPPKPAHPSLRYRLASVALGKKAAVSSDDPYAQQKEAKPSGRSIVMPTGSKTDAVKNIVEAVGEKRPTLSRGRVISIVVWSLIGLLLLLTLLFCWNRWWRYDDVLDVQGTWSANNSNTDIILNDTYMQLTDDVLYTYEIDPFSKTIKYEFGTSKGEGRYRFSFDRNELIITDGDYSWFSTLQEDIPWTLDTLWKNLTKTPQRSPLGDENVSVLKRVSRDTALTKTPKTDEELAAWRQETREAEAKAEEEALASGGITILNVTEGVPIEKPSEKAQDGENAGTGTDVTAGADTGTADTTTDTWQDPNATWDDGSTWQDPTYDQSWDSGYDTGYDQSYDTGYDTSWDTGYDQTYDYGYDQGYTGGYDQSYDYGYDQSYDTGYDAGYDQGYDQTYDAGATGYDTTGDQTGATGY